MSKMKIDNQTFFRQLYFTPMNTPIKTGRLKALFSQAKTTKNSLWKTSVDENGHFSIKRQTDNRQACPSNAHRSQKS